MGGRRHDGVAGGDGCGTWGDQGPHPSSCGDCGDWAGTDAGVLAPLLPAAARVVEVHGDVPAAAHRAAEAELAVVASALPGRRAEFLTGRWCARLALHRLGSPAPAVLPGVRRAPVWPAGVVGSITHCTTGQGPGYRAAAVALSRDVAALGVDVTPHEPLPERVLDAVAVPGERTALAGAAPGLPGVHLDRVLFSAKESLIKAWSALDPQWRGFAGFGVELGDGVFTATALGDGRVFEGRWALRAGLVATAVALPARTSVRPQRVP